MASAALTCRPEATASVMPASIRMLPIAGIGSGATPAPKICASAVDCAAIEPASCSASTISRMAMPSIRPIDASTSSMAANGRVGIGRDEAGGDHRPDHQREGEGEAEPHPRRDRLLAEARQQRGDGADPDEDQDEAGEPGLGQVEELGEALHQARPSTAGRALVPISSKDSTGLRMPLAVSTVCRKRRRLVEVTTAG